MTRLLSIVPLVLVACSSDPVSYSAPVGINLKAKSGDVNGTAISTSKGITTEVANPYGMFVADATAKLGRAPGSVDVDSATLVLGGDSKNVAMLEAVFTGVVDLAFVIDDSNNTYDVGKITNPSGVGPGDFGLTFDPSAIAPQDNAKYLAGGFKVVVRGDAAPGFPGGNAEASLQVTFKFAAFE